RLPRSQTPQQQPAEVHPPILESRPKPSSCVARTTGAAKCSLPCLARRPTMHIGPTCTWTFRTERPRSANKLQPGENLSRETPLLHRFAFAWTAPLTPAVLRWAADAPWLPN